MEDKFKLDSRCFIKDVAQAWMLSRPGPQSSTSSIPSANLLRSVIKLFKLGRLEFKKFNMWKAQALHFIAPIVSDRQSWGIEGDLVSDETGPV